jgi:hypothetical protein
MTPRSIQVGLEITTVKLWPSFVTTLPVKHNNIIFNCQGRAKMARAVRMQFAAQMNTVDVNHLQKISRRETWV